MSGGVWPARWGLGVCRDGPRPETPDGPSPARVRGSPAGEPRGPRATTPTRSALLANRRWSAVVSRQPRIFFSSCPQLRKDVLLVTAKTNRMAVRAQVATGRRWDRQSRGFAMVEHGERDDGTLPHPSVSDRRAACLQFERAWRAKEVLGIEEFAAQTPYEVRGKLLTDLIACEMSLRTAAGENVDPLDYRRRFPDCPSEVDAGYQQFRQRAAVRVEGSVGESEDDLVRFLDDYLAGLHDGRVPDKAALLAADPSIADKLEGCLAGIDFLHHTRTYDPLPDAFGRYAVLSTLGRGAFGVVCLARDTELNRLVALKVPPEGRFTSADEIDRFMVEAHTAANWSTQGLSRCTTCFATRIGW